MAKGNSFYTLFLPLLISISAGLLWTENGFAQTTVTYYVQLTNKKNNDFTIDKPQAFLSPKAIERRKLQNIPITNDDLPVTGIYLRQISNICQVLYTLKWANGVVIKSDDPSIIQRLKGYPFVSEIRMISGGGPSTRHKQLDEGAVLKEAQSSMDSTFYGAATRQSMMIHINKLHEKGYWGDGVIIAMMDAGFLNVNVNPFFQQTFDANKIIYTWNVVYGDSDVYSAPRANPHGGETFSCIASNKPYQMVGTAPNAKFALFHTEDTRSETMVEEYNWAAAAEVADSLGADVFSTSLGYTTFDASDSIDSHTYADMNGHKTPIAQAVNKAASKGILVINSAGNEGGNSWHYIATPGDADSGVTIGAVTPAALIAGFSSRGPNSSGQIKPDICAQGAPSALVTPSGSVSYASGTSFSCPISAGAFACLRQAFPSAPSMVIADAVRQSCDRYTTPDADYGYGIPDFGDAYNRLKSFYPNDTITYVNSTRVFPNPFSTKLTIIMTDLLQDSINTGELYDVAGQKVWTGSAPTVTFTNNIWEISPPANLAAGVYILSINHTRKYRLIKK